VCQGLLQALYKAFTITFITDMRTILQQMKHSKIKEPRIKTISTLNQGLVETNRKL
jgi:hypothetical protein